jgi:uncharacterized protein (DUF697 family)
MVQRFGALDMMRTMVGVLREVSLEDIREQANLAPRFLVVGPSAEQARALGLEITGPEGQFATIARGALEPVDAVGRLDAAVIWDPERTGVGSRVAEALRFESPPVPIVRFEGSGTHDLAAIDGVRSELVKRSPERATGLGRALPAFRPAASKQIIDETSAANAQFSLVSNIPALIPVIGSIAAAGADFIVLTKNQVMMIYKLAAVYGRDMENQRGILQEVLPVIGAGLVWRTIAREAAALLPFAAGAIPKLAIAYIGTMVVGRAAEFYYRTGIKPSRDQMEQYYRQALDLMRDLDLPGVRRFIKPRSSSSEPGAPPRLTVVGEESRPPREFGSGGN